MRFVFAVLLCIAIANAFSVPATTQEQSVRDLIGRVFGESLQKRVKVQMIENVNSKKDLWIVENGAIPGTISVKGTSGTAMANGLYMYLKYYCNTTLSWGEDGTGDHISIPDVLPSLPNPWKQEIFAEYRYNMNVCTFGYSYAHWEWPRWEREIDWMALNGINMPLAFNGQEYIFYQVYRELGLSHERIMNHFTCVHFDPWNRMGNIKMWNVPMTLNFLKHELELNKQIVEREVALGMFPVLPAFAGYVPDELIVKYPNVSYSISPSWTNWEPPYGRLVLLEPVDPLFKKIGSMFIKAQNDFYGYTSHFYNGDLFMEMDPKSMDPEYLSSCSRGMVESIKEGDPEGVWLMETWVFINFHVWTEDRVTAFLSGIEKTEDAILLDLMSDLKPIYNKAGDNKKRFIWGSLPNFGAVKGLYGDLGAIAEGPQEALNAYPDYFVGIGAFMEGIDQNVVVYDLLFEMAWRKEVDLTEWLHQYSVRRYGIDNADLKAMWDVLLPRVYHQKEHIYPHPPMIWEPFYNREYSVTDLDDIANAYHLMVKFAEEHKDMKLEEPLYYDMVDVVRQQYQNLFAEVLRLFGTHIRECMPFTDEFTFMKDADVYDSIIGKAICKDETGEKRPCTIEEIKAECVKRPNCAAFNSNGVLKSFIRKGETTEGTDLYIRQTEFKTNQCQPAARAISEKLLLLIKEVDNLLSTNKNFQLGIWTRGAMAKAAFAVDEEHPLDHMERIFLFSAKNIITLWGPYAEINDYSAREWAGLTEDYYMGRWKKYFAMLFDALDRNTTLIHEDYHKKVVDWGVGWDFKMDLYTVTHFDPIPCILRQRKDLFLAVMEKFDVHKEVTVAGVKPYHISKTHDVEMLAHLCEADETCIAFNTKGELFNTRGREIPEVGVDLYLKA